MCSQLTTDSNLLGYPWSIEGSLEVENISQTFLRNSVKIFEIE